MASLVAAQLSTGARTPISQAVDHGAAANGISLHPTVLPFRKREIVHGAACETIDGSRSLGFLDRREVIANMIVASGAALLSLGAGVDAAHAAKGEIETAEEAATNPLIQSMDNPTLPYSSLERVS